MLLMLVSAPPSARGCGGCFKLPYQSLLERAERADRVVVADATDPTGTSWKLQRVIKGRYAAGEETIDADKLPRKSRPNFYGSHILTWDQTFDTWTIEAPANDELVDFLRHSVGMSTSQSELMPIRHQAGQLRFYLPYLEHPDRQIADSTHSKLIDAPYAVLQELAADLDIEKLRSFIDDQTASKNQRLPLSIVLLGICGEQPEADMVREWIAQCSKGGDSAYLAALFTAHVELCGEDAVRFLEKSYLQNRDRTLDEVLAAIDALRTHGQAGTTISRERITVSLQLLLRERPVLAETVIDDFARWKDWSIAPRLMDIHAKGRQPWNNRIIINYLEACPSVRAKQYLQRLATADGAGVRPKPTITTDQKQ